MEFKPGVLTKKGAVDGTGGGNAKVYWATVQGREGGRKTGNVLWFEEGKLGGLVRIDFGVIG